MYPIFNDVGGDEDADALNQVAYDVNNGGSDVDILLLLGQRRHFRHSWLLLLLLLLLQLLMVVRVWRGGRGDVGGGVGVDGAGGGGGGGSGVGEVVHQIGRMIASTRTLGRSGREEEGESEKKNRKKPRY